MKSQRRKLRLKRKKKALKAVKTKMKSASSVKTGK